MNIGFIVDASSKIGLGHWSRCINIAKILNKKSYFFSRYYPSEYKRSKNINLVKIKKKKFCIEELKDKVIKFKINILIIDNYTFNFNLQKNIKKYVKKLIIIDDCIYKRYCCDLIINYSFLDKKEETILKKKNSKIIFALGPKYLPLHPKFFELKKKVKIRKNIKNILIFFGGSDSKNLTEKLLVLSKFFKYIKFSIILGSVNKNKTRIIKKIKNYENIKIFYGIENKKVANLIFKNDLAIGAGGVNLFERIYLGLPSIVIDIDKNQLLNIKNAKKRGLINHLSRKKFTINRLVKMIQVLIKNQDKFNKISVKCFNYLKLDQKKHISKLLNLRINL